MIEMHNRDCMELMAELPDKAFYFAPVDPPYGIGEDGRKTKSRQGYVRQKNGSRIYLPANPYKVAGWDIAPPSDEYFEELFRVSCNSAIWGANYFPQIVGTPFKPPRRHEYDAFLEAHPTGWIIWDKVNGGTDFSDCELAWTSFDRPTRVLVYMWNGFSQGKSLKEGRIQKGDKRENEKRIHPTQKPVALYKWLLTNYAKPGDKILDTHGGSGSICIACHDLGFDLTWTELDPDYYAAAVKRYQQHAAQLQMFVQ